MCTVTIIPHEAGIRLACNRDEARARPPALPPRVVTLENRQALMPIDPQSGGTWIAANDAGLIFTLLNVNPKPRDGPALPARKSRGTIIPALGSAPTLAEACARMQTRTSAEFAPFRLMIADRSSCAEFRFDGKEGTQTSFEFHGKPMMFTSSGLGDALVDEPRRALFEEFFVAGADWRERQDAYHCHSWPDRRDVSVCMSRANARTVSFTVVDLSAQTVRMTYSPEAPDQDSTPIACTLALRSKT